MLSRRLAGEKEQHVEGEARKQLCGAGHRGSCCVRELDGRGRRGVERELWCSVLWAGDAAAGGECTYDGSKGVKPM